MAFDANGALTATRLLAAGTYSTNPTASSGVAIHDYTGSIMVILDAGASLTGVGTLDVRIETAGTAASGFQGVTSSGTFLQANAAGTYQTIGIDTQAYNGYLRAFAAIGSSGRYPMSVTLVGKKINEP